MIIKQGLQAMRVLTATRTAIIQHLAFAPDCSRLAAACKKANARVWDLTSGKALTLKSSRNVELIGFARGPDELVVASYDMPAAVHDLSGGGVRLVGPPEGPGFCWDSVLSPGGDRLVRVERRGVVCYNVDDGSLLWEKPWGTGTSLYPRVRFDAVGARVFFIDRHVAILDAADGAEVSGFDLTFRRYESINTAALSPDGRWLAIHGPDGLQVLDTADGSLALEYPPMTYGHGLAFTPDGAQLAATRFGSPLPAVLFGAASAFTRGTVTFVAWDAGCHPSSQLVQTLLLRRMTMARCVLVGLAVCCLALYLNAEEVDKSIKGTVQAGVHEFALSPDSFYIATLTSKKYSHDLYIKGITYESDRSEERIPGIFKEVLLFSPGAACKITARVEVAYNAPGGPHEYTLEVQRRMLDPQPLLKVEGKLTAKDVKGEDKIAYKAHKVKLVKGRWYVAEMSPNSEEFLVCPGFYHSGKGETEGSDFTSFRADDEGGKALRLVFRPRYSGEYEAWAGTFNDPARKEYPYQLVVYQEKPR